LSGEGEGGGAVLICGRPGDGCGGWSYVDLGVWDALAVLVVDLVGDGGGFSAADSDGGVVGEGDGGVADALGLVGVVGVLSVDFDEVVSGWEVGEVDGFGE